MLRDGITLLLIGMGTVYLFLILLVYCTQLMSSLIARFFPETVISPPAIPLPVMESDTRQQQEMAAAVSAAVHHHRQRG